MSARFSPWAQATHCTGGPTRGAQALLKVILALFPAAYSLGIYNCRSVRGARTTSMHGEGRALDVGFKMIRGRANPLGTVLVKLLLKVGPSRLGIQCIIWNRRIYSAKNPSGARYTGLVPHYDHVHIELTRNAGEKLTVATCRTVLTMVAAPVVRTLKTRRRYVVTDRTYARRKPSMARGDNLVQVRKKGFTFTGTATTVVDGRTFVRATLRWYDATDLDLVKG